MQLEARAENCFSSTHVLKLNGQPIGRITGRFFGEGMDLSLTGRRHLKLDREGWLTSQFKLKDGETDEVLVEARPAGIFTTSWELNLTCGPAEMSRRGFFSSGYDVRMGKRIVGSVDRLRGCARGWQVVKIADEMEAPDLILVGLVFHIIAKRQQQAAMHAS
jgi:hypothetical protein